MRPLRHFTLMQHEHNTGKRMRDKNEDKERNIQEDP